MIEFITKFETLVAVALGAGISFIATGIIEIFRVKADSEKDKRQNQREGLYNPIISFTDEMLVLISKAYWDKVDEKEVNIEELLEKFRNKEAVIESRLSALDNNEINEHFYALDKSYSSFRDKLGNNKLAEARNKMKEAYLHAGKLLRKVYELKDK